MTTETNDQLIARLKRELAEAEAERDRPKVWKPKDGETYWFIGAIGSPEITEWDDDEYDQHRYVIGNCFPTPESAERDTARRILIADMRRWAEERNCKLMLTVRLLCDSTEWTAADREMRGTFADRLHLLSDE